MSLLNDALKRAKLEALEREATGKSNYGMPTLPSDAGGRRISVPAILVAIVLLAALGVLIGWLLGRVTTSTSSEPVPGGSGQLTVEALPATIESDPSGAVEVGDADGAADAPVATTHTEDEAAVDSSQVVAARPEAARVEPTTGAASSGAGTEVEVQSAPDAAAEAAQPEAGTRLSPTDGATYVRVLEQRGQRLELQGIAFRGGTSVAIINDLMVSRDDMVEGFLVVAIEPDRVQLQSGGVTFYVALH